MRRRLQRFTGIGAHPPSQLASTFSRVSIWMVRADFQISNDAEILTRPRLTLTLWYHKATSRTDEPCARYQRYNRPRPGRREDIVKRCPIALLPFPIQAPSYETRTPEFCDAMMQVEGDFESSIWKSRVSDVLSNLVQLF
jgi:hypothetical protein